VALVDVLGDQRRTAFYANQKWPAGHITVQWRVDKARQQQSGVDVLAQQFGASGFHITDQSGLARRVGRCMRQAAFAGHRGYCNQMAMALLAKQRAGRVQARNRADQIGFHGQPGALEVATAGFSGQSDTGVGNNPV
jgi:hypothetical protein